MLYVRVDQMLDHDDSGDVDINEFMESFRISMDLEGSEERDIPQSSSFQRGRGWFRNK